MSVSRVYSRGALKLDVANPSVPVIVGGIRNISLRSGSDVRADRTGGDIYPRYIALYSQKPVCTFRCACLADILAQCGLTGLAIDNNGVSIYAQEFEEGATVKAGANHRRFLIQEGIIVPRRLTCDHQGDAEIEYDILPTYDGTNDPVIESDTNALPTAPADDERFTIGAFTIESVVCGQLSKIEIDFGVQAQLASADSDRWDTHASIRAIEPVITLTGTDLQWLKAANIPRTGKAVTHAATKMYLRKRSTGATGFLADVTAEHIKFTAAGMAVIEGIFEDNDDEPSAITLTLTTNYDGSNAPLTINTASAIT